SPPPKRPRISPCSCTSALYQAEHRLSRRRRGVAKTTSSAAYSASPLRTFLSVFDKKLDKYGLFLSNSLTVFPRRMQSRRLTQPYVTPQEFWNKNCFRKTLFFWCSW